MSAGDTEKRLQSDMEGRLRRVKALFFDVDGVLTDGKIYLGRREDAKAYSTKDGFGILTAGLAGLEISLVTGRSSGSVTRRAGELGIKAFQNVENKLACVSAACRRAGFSLDEVGFVGDDLNDLKVMRKVGVSFAVANAADEVKAVAHLTISRNGGEGAAREVIELVLRSQGKWDEAVKKLVG